MSATTSPISSTLSNLSWSINQQGQRNQQAALDLGGGMERARGDLMSELSKEEPDQARVSVLQMKLEQRSMLFQAFQSVQQVMNRIMQRLIDGLGQIGR